MACRALIALCLVGCVHARGQHVHMSAAQQSDAAVWIDVRCDLSGQNLRFVASGGIVSSRHVLTARHVVDSCPGEIPDLHVQTANGSRYRVVWFKWLPGDAVLLQRMDAGHWSGAVRPIVAEPARSGRVCVSAVAPERKRLCGDVRDVHVGNMLVRYDSMTVKGNSGSLVYDRFGHLVGVHSGHFEGSRDAYMVRVRPELMP